MAKKNWIFIVLLSCTLAMGACGAKGYPAPEESSVTVSSGSSIDSQIDSEFSMTKSELEEIFLNIRDKLYFQVMFEPTDCELSYRHIEDNTFIITAKLAEYTSDDYTWPSVDYCFTIEAYKSNRWELGELTNFETYTDLGHVSSVVRGVFDLTTQTFSYALFDTVNQTNISDYYAYIGLQDERGAMCVETFDDLFGFINSDGSMIAPAIFNEVYDFGFVKDKDAALVKAGNVWGIINHAGQYVIEPSYYELIPCGDYVSATQEHTRSGWSSSFTSSLMDWDGEVLIPEGSGVKMVYYEPGYYVCANENYEGKLYDSDFAPHDFSNVYSQLGMAYTPGSSGTIRCHSTGWNFLHTGGQYIYLLNEDMELISEYKFVLQSSTVNKDRFIGRISSGLDSFQDIMIDHDGNLIMVMPQERRAGLLYRYSGDITDYYCFGEYLGDSTTRPFFYIMNTDEIVICSKYKRIPNSECVVVKLKDSSLYCVYDKGVRVKEPFYTDYSYDYETGAVTLMVSDSQTDTYIPQ